MATCTALNLSDEQLCTQEATSANGLFCRLHAKQCYGLYKGYKIRNAKLDALDAAPPPELSKKGSITTSGFAHIEDESTLEALHNYLFTRYALLDRVIRARKLHHSRFFSLSLDYGHKAYLDKLTNERFQTLRALERLERRTAEVLYANSKWFKWVRQQQDDENAARENEAKQIKREAQLFKRHRQEVQARLRTKKRAEDTKRQEAFLEQAYQERQQTSEEEDYDESKWDPIEDEIEEDKGKFVDMMKYLLWLQSSDEPTAEHEELQASEGATSEQSPTAKENVTPVATADTNASTAPVKAMNRNQKKRAKKQVKDMVTQPNKAHGEDDATSTPRIDVNETSEQVRKRLLEGQSYDPTTGKNGFTIAGIIEKPAETHGKILGLPSDEVDQLIEDVREIKQLLLCRLLLSQASLLPAALRAENLEDFFLDPEVTSAELRDLCLKLEQPSLQEIRDACADFARADDEVPDSDGENDSLDEQEAHDRALDKRTRNRGFLRRYDDMPAVWKSKHELKLEKNKGKSPKIDLEGTTNVDFGEVDNKGDFKNKPVRVTVCGKSIWNYPSEKSVARRGWLHFSIIASGTKFGAAIQLCRNWDEFWELNILAIYEYFPSASWAKWSGDRSRTQSLQLGFVPRYQFTSAYELTSKQQVKGRGTGPTSHAVVQYRNVVCAHIKRADPISRRFVQYLQLMASDLCVLVRDAKTGRIIVMPPKEQWWLAREKIGLGRASKSEWRIIGEVGEQMFEQLSDSMYSDFRFSFGDHYDIIIWDLKPGLPHEMLEDRIHGALIKANRFTEARDCYSKAAPVLRTIHRDKTTMRCRDLKAGEDSVWDDLQHPETRSMEHLIDHRTREVREMTVEEKVQRYYNDIDAAEDTVLFPEEQEGRLITAIASHADALTRELEENGPNMTRFVHGLNSDDDSEDYEENDWARRRQLQKAADSKKLKQLKQPRGQTRRQRNAAFNSKNDVPSDKYASVHDLAARLESAKDRKFEWKDGEECPNDYAADCECDVCLDAEYGHGHNTLTIRNRRDEIDSQEEEDRDWEDADDLTDDERDEDGVTDADLELVEQDPSKLKKLKQFVFSDGPLQEDVERAFAMHLDRERSKAFRPQWHASDFEPGAFERYAELQSLMEESRDVNQRWPWMRGAQMQTLFRLGVHIREHRLVFRDIVDTFAFVGLFFPAPLDSGKIQDWRSSLKERTKLVDNNWKATQSPYYKDWRDAKLIPKDFWPPTGPYLDSHDPPGADIPREWDSVSRPLVARLYKAGIIAPYHHPDAAGRLIVAVDPMTNKKDMFMDYRRIRDDAPARAMTHITDWPSVDLLKIASLQSLTNREARFALLRVWSHSHYWPLMVGIEARDPWAFQDCRGRSWQWKFYPKERYGSNFSMQYTIDMRLERWRSLFGKNIRVRRDIVLVMGKDREELEEMMICAVFALQTNPWRLEVDFWRSFVNVDYEFLSQLDKRWLE